MKLKSLVAFVMIVGAGLVAVGFAGHQQQEPAPVQPDSPFHQIAADNGMIAINLGGTQDYQQVGLIDTERRVMSVYHVQRASGEVMLQSVRNCTWDLQLDEYNGLRPSPREIRDLTERHSSNGR